MHVTCRKKTENNTRTNRYAQVHKMRNNCVGTVLRQAQQHSGSIGLSHTSLGLKHADFPQVKVPNTVQHNEAVDILRRDVQVIQMLTRSELCGHRNATLNTWGSLVLLQM